MTVSAAVSIVANVAAMVLGLLRMLWLLFKHLQHSSAVMAAAASTPDVAASS